MLIAVFLHKIYQLAYKRIASMTGRVLHAICNLLLGLIITDRHVLLVTRLCLFKLITKVLLYVYFKYKVAFNSIIFAFIVSYYFLSTYTRMPTMSYILPEVPAFDFMISRRHQKPHILIASYFSLFAFMAASYTTQRLIYKAKASGLENWKEKMPF